MSIRYPEIIRASIRFYSECIQDRMLIWNVFKHNYVLQHRNTLLGYFWLIVNPCIPIFIYNLLQFMGIFANDQHGIPRAIYLSLGLIVYYTFSESANILTAFPVRNRVFLLGGGVEKSVAIMASILEVFANFLIRYSLYLILLGFYGFSVIKAITFVPVLVLFLVLLGSGLGIILSVFNVLLKDVSNVVSMACFYLLFGSGVFGVIEKTNLFFTFLTYSPVYMVINHSREYVFWSGASISVGFVAGMIASVLIFMISLVGFFRVESRINPFL